VTVGGVDGDDVDRHRNQRLDALLDVVADPHCGRATQPAATVTRCVRVVEPLLDVLDGDQPGELAVLVDERELLDAVTLQDRFGIVE
jgi:hypothetical protein